MQINCNCRKLLKYLFDKYCEVFVVRRAFEIFMSKNTVTEAIEYKFIRSIIDYLINFAISNPLLKSITKIFALNLDGFARFV